MIEQSELVTQLTEAKDLIAVKRSQYEDVNEQAKQARKELASAERAYNALITKALKDASPAQVAEMLQAQMSE